MGSGVEGGISRVVGFLRLVMRNDASERRTAQLSTSTVVAKLSGTRSPLYVDKESLEVFQSTLTCQIRDALECSRLCSWTVSRDNPRILDVGGGDGEFTFHFLQNLADRGFKTAEVTVVEPGNWKREYETLVGELANTVDFHQIGFQDYQPNAEQFDIVMASHSLYGVFDVHLTNDEDRREIIGKLTSMVRSGGYAFILLAAPHARSYYFKTDALRELFGWEPPDATAATVKTTLAERGFSRKYVDNVMNMEEILREFRNGAPERLLRWLAYFLRVDCKSLDAADREFLTDKIIYYVVKCESLTEEFAVELQAISRGLITPKSSVIPHKSALYSWRKSE